ncbi:MAG: hypothetical protein L0229_04345 [Blastocatellia bacterium]|nr:hypothetical protein [Blastocatellia bacterium]
MIAKSYILKDLTTIEVLFRETPTLKKQLFFSKLAILELCGWIEISMDDIVLRCAKRHLKDQSNIEMVEKAIVGRVYGFEYEAHFRKMLIQLIGTICVERLERKLDQRKFQPMKSNLNDLKAIRNQEAHTHLKGATKRLDAPSVTKNRFFTIYDGLKDIEDKLRSFDL